MAITVSLQHASFQLGAGGTEGASLTSPSGTWAVNDGILFVMAIHHNAVETRDMIGLTTSGGAINTPQFANVGEFTTTYDMGAGAGFATVTTGFTGTTTGTRTASTGDQWLTGTVFKVSGHNQVTPIRQVKSDFTPNGSGTSVAVTLDTAPLSSSLLVAMCVANANESWNLSSGWDAKSDIAESGWGGFHSTQWKNGGGSRTTTFTCTANTGGIVAVVFEIAVDGDTVTPDATAAPFPRRTYFILQ